MGSVVIELRGGPVLRVALLVCAPLSWCESRGPWFSPSSDCWSLTFRSRVLVFWERKLLCFTMFHSYSAVCAGDGASDSFVKQSELLISVSFAFSVWLHLIWGASHKIESKTSPVSLKVKCSFTEAEHFSKNILSLSRFDLNRQLWLFPPDMNTCSIVTGLWSEVKVVWYFDEVVAAVELESVYKVIHPCLCCGLVKKGLLSLWDGGSSRYWRVISSDYLESRGLTGHEEDLSIDESKTQLKSPLPIMLVVSRSGIRLKTPQTSCVWTD